MRIDSSSRLIMMSVLMVQVLNCWWFTISVCHRMSLVAVMWVICY